MVDGVESGRKIKEAKTRQLAYRPLYGFGQTEGFKFSSTF